MRQRVFEGELKEVGFHKWVIVYSKQPDDCGKEHSMPVPIRWFTDPFNQVIPKGKVRITVEVEE